MGEKLDDDERPLTPAERAALRAMLESDRRVRWFWSTVRVYAVWIAAVIGAATIGIDALKAALRSLLAK